MNEGLIPKRYAKALFEYASERGKAESLYRLMGTLENSFRENPELQQTLENPFIDDSQKERLITTAADATSDDPVLADFLKLLARNKRLDMARGAA
ncbi:MAG: F0F1 ATP synthase subunit delta, partial [Muribaculaceae bacterium]|nr:F0F1 ATP synthase subunit delta [Muribaculaceae bacterium]